MQYIELFILGMMIGLLFELIFTACFELLTKKPLRITKKFSWGKKFSLLSLPLWGIFAIVISTQNYSIVTLFLVAGVIGTILEAAGGYFFYRAYKSKIWVYKHGALGQFTSFYSFPYWGSMGLIFGVLAKSLGL